MLVTSYLETIKMSLTKTSDVCENYGNFEQKGKGPELQGLDLDSDLKM